MAIDFPNSPTTNQTFTVGTRTWIWDGTTWELVATSSDPIQKTIVDAKGDLIAGTNSDAVARLAVGTNGQVLTADSATATGLKWAAAASGSVTKISATSVSGAASLSLDNVFTSTYRNYLIVGSWSGTDGAWLNIRYRTSGSDNTTANYSDQRLEANNTTISGDRTTGQTAARLGGSRNALLNTVAVWVYSPQATERTLWSTVNVDQGSTCALIQFGGVFGATTSFDGFKVYPGSGNMTGNFAVYGIEN